MNSWTEIKCILFDHIQNTIYWAAMYFCYGYRFSHYLQFCDYIFELFWQCGIFIFFFILSFRDLTKLCWPSYINNMVQTKTISSLKLRSVSCLDSITLLDWCSMILEVTMNNLGLWPLTLHLTSMSCLNSDL
jgi:hypothetical protein